MNLLRLQLALKIEVDEEYLSVSATKNRLGRHSQRLHSMVISYYDVAV